LSLQFLLLLGCIPAQILFSQDHNSGQNAKSVQTPVLGFVFDSQAHQIRPLLGVPGAAVLGAPLDAGIEIAGAALSPRQDYALVLSGENPGVQLLEFQPEGLSRRTIASAVTPERMYLSPSGSAAALYRASTGTVQVIAGLPDSPVLAREVGVTASGQTPTAIALSDDGRVLIAGIDDNQAVLVIGADGSTASIPLGYRVQALAFRPHTQDAAAAAGDVVFLLPDVTRIPQPIRVAGAEEGISGPTAVAFSNDGQRLFAANAGTGTVTASDLTAGNTAALACDCTLAGLGRLRGAAVFRLTEMPDPLLLFDGTANQPRILFVPPDQTGTTDVNGDQENQQ
jgi:hypothetical protein